jgi:nicotinamide mononucleotide transporter
MAGSVKLGWGETGAMISVSLLMVAASWFGWWSMAMTEVLGFVTGGVCVWLVVRQHIWNWPIGLANNVFFFVLFYQSRLYADMGLQVVYFGLGIYGWYHWLFGGANRTELTVTFVSKREWLSLVLFVFLWTFVLRELLIVVNGAAPFWDSLTTVLCLAAQYLLCRKRFENWYFWILADIIYVPLYFSRQLPLTGVLYGVLLLMCLVGLKQWQTSRHPVEVPA